MRKFASATKTKQYQTAGFTQHDPQHSSKLTPLPPHPHPSSGTGTAPNPALRPTNSTLLTSRPEETVGDQAARLGSIIRSLSQDTIGRKPLDAPSSSATAGAAPAQTNASNRPSASNSTFTSGSQQLPPPPPHHHGSTPGDMLRVQSGTGLTALRELQGLNHRNSSVDDFLSLVASGDIPPQDPQLLNNSLNSLMTKVQKNPSQQNLGLLHQYQQQILAQQKNMQGGGHQQNEQQQQQVRMIEKWGKGIEFTEGIGATDRG